MRHPYRLVCAGLLAAILSVSLTIGQTKPPVGIRQNTPAVHALTHARIVIAPGRVINNATLVVRNGIISAVGEDAAVPGDARIWDMTGMTIYPGFIDGYTDLGMPKKAQPSSGSGGDQGPPAQKPPDVQRGERHWNDNVLAAQNADELFVPDSKSAEKLRSMGFTAVLAVPQKGNFRGSDALYSLGDGAPNQLLLKPRVAQSVTFETGFGDDYPNSLMGAVALIRQTFLDAQWYRSAMQASAKYPDEPRPEVVEDLAALEASVNGQQPVLFETNDELSLLRASRIAKEFSLKLWARGSGYEYRRLDAVKAAAVPILLPLNFPDPPSVSSPEDAVGVSLEEMRYWDQAPENPGKLQNAGITFALTTATLKDPSSFLPNLRKAVERGLTRDGALAAITTVPAKLFGVDGKLGTISAGKMADFVVTDGDLFAEKTKVRETWVDGKRYEVKTPPEADVRGTWQALLSGTSADSLSLMVKGEPDGLQGSVKAKGKETKLTAVTMSAMQLALSFTGDSVGLPGVVRMSGTLFGESMIGRGELSDGKTFDWTASRKAPFKPEPDTSKSKPVQMSSLVQLYPPNGFGRPRLPEQPEHLFVRGATIWTCGSQGTLENADLLIEKGKITKVGKNLAAPADAVIVDGKGKQVTPGLIDCHSHTGVAGSVNETGKTITAEVRIGDVLDPDDLALYRELAGGLTCANVLHGSANPIGGQNQVIKLRWGMLPEQMKFEGAIPGIKFALGENPKQSNWGDRYNTRYPQTRGGVEEIIRDEFRAARDYEKSWKDFDDGKKHIPPRRDLQSEAILEVLRGKRLVHAHSYRQDEILMLMRVAEEFGFKIGTFQHVLEGYKVADVMARHGAGASTFSDWWAYKFEVYDAIPYNGTLMHDAGVVVSFNSDSDEQARRLNTEASKAVKYGGLSQEEALKFVTLNPAIQLKIDNRVGSLDPGKDADFVVWNGNPLSTYSICEQTWIDGRRFFDRDEDRAMNDEIRKERAALVQKILGSKKGAGGESRPQPSMGEKDRYSCHDDVEGKERP